MDPITIVLIALGVFAALLGGIMLLVAAFQQSVWWGLASLFLPFASLVFVLCHWARAKTGFLVSLVGTVLAVVGVVKAAPHLNEPLLRAAATQLAQQRGEPAPADLTTQIQEARQRIEQGEAQFAQDGATLARRFEALTARRKVLRNDDAAAVAEFNAEAAAYQAQNEARKLAKQELASARQQLEALLDQRARLGPGGSVAAGTAPIPSTVQTPRVVMFTTARCPACVAARSYLARKRVPYEERDVNNSPEARAEFQRLGGRGVPLILVGEERLEGFNPGRLEQLL